MRKQIWVLHKMLQPKSIFAFMQEHLRFPNMKVKIVDESNANASELKMIWGFKRKLGLPSP